MITGYFVITLSSIINNCHTVQDQLRCCPLLMGVSHLYIYMVGSKDFFDVVYERLIKEMAILISSNMIKTSS